MAELAVKHMTADEFLRWDYEREGKHELVDGLVVRLMVGTRDVHDIVVTNVSAALLALLRGSGCRPYSQDKAVRTRSDRIRRPDLTVDCGPRDKNTLEAVAPRAVFEVLSPSTRAIDATLKLDEYQGLDGLAHIVLIDPDVVDIVVWSREDTSAAGRWRAERLSSMEATLALPGIGAALPLAAIYEDADPAPAPPRPVE